MGRASKFVFPRSGRRAEPPPSAPTLQNYQSGTTQVYDSSTKAQRLLGTSEIPGYRGPGSNTPQPISLKPHKSNVPIPEESVDGEGDGNNGEIKIAFDTREHSPRPSGISQTRRPFSPQIYPSDNAAYSSSAEVGPEIFAHGTDPNAKKMLLDPSAASNIFQRKSSASSETNAAFVEQSMSERQAHLGMALPNRSCVSDLNFERNRELGAGETKSRPSRLDLSRLFPRSSFQRTVTPSQFEGNGPPMSVSSLGAKHVRPGEDGRTSNSQRHPRTKASMPNLIGRATGKTVDSGRSNSKNWFDGKEAGEGFEEDEQSDTLAQRNDITQSFPEPPLSARTAEFFSNRGSGKSSIGSKGCFYRDSGHSSSTRPMTSALDHRAATASLVPCSSDVQSVRSFSSRRTQNSSKSGSRMMNSDLNKQSVLSFSSSEDEDEDEDGSTPPSLDFDTSTRGSYEDDIHRLSDQMAAESRGGPTLDELRPRQGPRSYASSSGRSSVTIGNSEAFASEPNNTTPRNSQHLTRMYSNASSKFSIPSTINTKSSQAPSLRESLRSTSTTSTARLSEVEYLLQARQDRLMAVTHEEEALLEAMRRKRTRMHQEHAEQRQRSAARSRKPTISPVPEDRVSIISDATSFPSPPRQTRHEPRSRERRPPALSSEALKRNSKEKFLPTPKVSPTIHFDMSNLLLSSRESVHSLPPQQEEEQKQLGLADPALSNPFATSSPFPDHHLFPEDDFQQQTRTARSGCVTEGAEKADKQGLVNQAALK
ncbi:hypothetical protein L228DRAFT_243657 [Xylona heveae TC161]|uniref:Uncharacterized protein n=1 Tax=Xylona heveae (strain CBS 132557 / TC161) TaxID=1328760 RepID=A0A165IHP5_XYLHT|nr:hypothetical protein L228DRAFT_243657 [Xylona heveae TC161]KZF24911.1 hypothetical protein L228DRAFT_243657 [Xylona heveae TC161]